MPGTPQTGYQTRRIPATNSVLLVRPTGFEFNPETAQSNRFAQNLGVDLAQVITEFDGLVSALTAHGIQTIVVDGPPNPPDACFPNNWISALDDGRVAVYPMATESRRRERVALPQVLGNREVLDLTSWEAQGKYLEGTGSLVLDRANRIAYASRSQRTNLEAVQRWCQLNDYWPLTFEARDRYAHEIYHTNVALSVGSDWAVFCSEACPAPNPVLAELKLGGKFVVEITLDQMEHFCGNVIELDGVFVASRSAWDAFTAAQREFLARGRTPVICDISTIEQVGGGSVRCMIAEWF